jgi:hypothetical protein
MKGHDQVLAAEIVARTDRDPALAGYRGNHELRRWIANFQGHGFHGIKRPLGWVQFGEKAKASTTEYTEEH